jgi:peptidoglycan hydrolase-like protein with peptidoglycan-binding domain
MGSVVANEVEVMNGTDVSSFPTSQDEEMLSPAVPEPFDAASALGAGRRRRRWPWLLVGAGLGVAGTFATIEWQDQQNTDAETGRTETVVFSTVAVVAADLIDSVEYDGELTGGSTQSLLAGADGTVTSALQLGDLVGRGTVVATVDAEPVVAMYGDSPFWRALESGDEGADVLQLEANLSALGFTANGEMTVDTDFTSSTADAVEAWELSLGIEETGDVLLGRVIALGGPSTVSEILDVGGQARSGTQLLLVEAAADTVDLVVNGITLADDAVIADPIAVGAAVSHGTTLLTIDGVAVQAVTDNLGVNGPIIDAMADADIESLENLMVFFGFDPDGSIVVDDEADLATVAAVIAWQESAGLQATGGLDAGHYVVAPSGSDVAAVHVAPGAALNGGALAVTVERSTLSVSLEVVVDESDTFEVGTAVEVEFADESVIAGTVVQIADVANVAESADELPTIDVDIALDTAGADTEVVFGPVTVRLETDRIDDAVLIPTRALVSLQERGYAVQVRRADGDVLVGVELGAFDDGLVQVVDGSVEPGEDVVVPS